MADPKESTLVKDLKAAWNKKNAGADAWDEQNPPHLVTTEGWLSNPITIAGAKCRRIYLNHSCTEYYELSDGDVIHSQPSGGPNDRERIWVRHGADITIVRKRYSTAEATPRLLSGAVTQAHVTSAQPVGGTTGGVVYATAAPADPWSDPGDGGWEITQCHKCWSASP